MMNHLQKNELIFQRQYRIIEEFINLILDKSKSAEFKSWIIYHFNDKLKDCGDAIVTKIINKTSDQIIDLLIGGLLDSKYYIILNIFCHNMICEFRDIKNTDGVLVFPSGFCFSERYVDKNLFLLVYNIPEVKKLLNINPYTELWKLSDKEFDSVLNNAITIVKTLELFE